MKKSNGDSSVGGDGWGVGKKAEGVTRRKSEKFTVGKEKITPWEVVPGNSELLTSRGATMRKVGGKEQVL